MSEFITGSAQIALTGLIFGTYTIPAETESLVIQGGFWTNSGYRLLFAARASSVNPFDGTGDVAFADGYIAQGGFAELPVSQMRQKSYLHWALVDSAGAAATGGALDYLYVLRVV